MWGSSWPLNQPTRNAQEISARWNEETLDNNPKPYGKIKISLKVNKGNLKTNIFVTMVCNCTLSSTGFKRPIYLTTT